MIIYLEQTYTQIFLNAKNPVKYNINFALAKLIIFLVLKYTISWSHNTLDT